MKPISLSPQTNLALKTNIIKHALTGKHNKKCKLQKEKPRCQTVLATV